MCLHGYHFYFVTDAHSKHIDLAMCTCTTTQFCKYLSVACLWLGTEKSSDTWTATTLTKLCKSNAPFTQRCISVLLANSGCYWILQTHSCFPWTDVQCSSSWLTKVIWVRINSFYLVEKTAVWTSSHQMTQYNLIS